MDAKTYIREFLRSHQGVEYSQEELAAKVNEYEHFDTPIQINPEEVLKYGRELAQEEDNIHHWTVTGSYTVIINGERRFLVDDDDYLRYDVVADLAPRRLEEVEHLHGRELMEWIIEELADIIEESAVEHRFKYEGRGWGGPD